jgi:predicted peptidase
MPFRKFFSRAGALLFLISLVMPAHSAATVTKDDVDFRKKVFVGTKNQRLSYRLYVPVTYSREIKYPLVMWLHGSEGRGSDNLAQIIRGNALGSHFWISPENQAKFPTFVFAPQCPAGDDWSDPELNQPTKALDLAIAALGEVEKEFSIDLDRVYIVGQSMGGLGVYSLVQLYPEKWAGAVVMCAFDNFTSVPALTHVPLWVFQGDEDQSVPVNLVREMIKQLRKAQANLRYTEYHKVDHQVWNKAFAEPDLLPWLSSQKRGQTPSPSPPPASNGPLSQGQVGSSAPATIH